MQLTNYSKFDPKQFRLLELFRFQWYLMDWQIYNDDNCVISGYIEIIDLSKLSLSFLTQFEPMLMKKMGVFAEKAAPMRLKGVHLVNCPKEAQAVLSLVRSLMSEKLQKRVCLSLIFMFIDYSHLIYCISFTVLCSQKSGGTL